MNHQRRGIRRSRWLPTLASIIASPLAIAEGPGVADEIDPVIVSPDNYEVVMENDYVRVVRYEILPGQRDQWHTHPPKVSVITSGGRLRITTADGDSFEVTEETGAATWMAALGRHFGENIGTTPVQIVFVEVKSAAASSNGRVRPATE